MRPRRWPAGAARDTRSRYNTSILGTVNNLGESQASWTRPKESRKATYFFSQFDIGSLFGFVLMVIASLFGFFIVFSDIV